MDELLDSIKKGVKSLLDDSSKEEQVRLQQVQQIVSKQAEQLANCLQQIAVLQNSLKTSEAEVEEQKRKLNELDAWKQQAEIRLNKLESQIVADIPSISEPKSFCKDLPASCEVHQGDKDTSLWPRRFYADSYSNFSPYGFCESDFSSENQEQLYIIEQLSATEATFIINEQLDFSRVISNYKYGLKAVCEEISRTEHPTSLSVVKPGRLKLVDNVWEITEKITINIV